jgi:uncharacterized protein (TIGR04255 family)
MSEKMSNAPVYYALAQAQFNPVAAMEKYVIDIQDVLRRDGYTLFEAQEVTQLQFIAAPGETVAEPKLIPTHTWLITKADRTSGFVLSQTSLIYHTTHYETSDKFISDLLCGLKAIHDVVTLDHLSRLGLRYLDAILPHSNEKVDSYLVKGLHGVEFGAAQRYSLIESVFETSSGPLLPKGTLVARVHRATSQLGYPPDMVPNGLLPMSRFENTNVISHAIIDTDHFVEGIMPLDFNQIKDQYVNLHATIKDAFNAMITEYATETWA